MVDRILIAFATREGHARRVSEYLAESLRVRGAQADLVDVRRAPINHWEAYDRVVVVASVHLARHESEMVDFVLANRTRLEERDAGFVSVCMTEARAQDLELPNDEREEAAVHVQEQMETFFHQTGWRPRHFMPVAGAIMYSRYNLLMRMVVRRVAEKSGMSTDTSHDHVYTDWAALERFCDELLDLVVTPTPLNTGLVEQVN